MADTATSPDTSTDPAPVSDADRFHALLVVEQIETGDNRLFSADALTWRDLPLPLMAKATDEHGSEGADTHSTLIGNIDQIERVGNEIHGYGSYVTDPDDEAANLIKLVKARELRGISIDVDAVAAEFLAPTEWFEAEDPDAGQKRETDDNGDEWVVLSERDPKQRITEGRIIGATVVPFPAFQEAFIEPDSGGAASDKPEAVTAAIGDPGTATMHVSGVEFAAVDADGEMAGQLADGITLTVESGSIAENDAWSELIGRLDESAAEYRASRDVADVEDGDYSIDIETVPEADDEEPADDESMNASGSLTAAAPGLMFDADVTGGMIDPVMSVDALTAAAASDPWDVPVEPPTAWFVVPEADGPTPLTFTDDGQVFGHLALWNECHVGIQDVCTMAPRSPSDYSRFHVGEVRTADGDRVAVGNLTFKTGHAGDKLAAKPTRDHYDNTGTLAAQIVAHDGQHGIWVCGAVVPGLSLADRRVLMSTPPSGDWRRFGSSLDLVAALSVNTPGFNTPRARFRRDEVDGMVASLIVWRHDGDTEQRALTDAHANIIIDALATSIRRTPNDRVQALAASIRGEN